MSSEAPRRGLIVEDDEDFIEILERVCRGEGLETDICRDGISALGRIQKNDYQVLIIDLQIPGLDGLELVEYLKVNAPAMLPRVVVFTGFQTIAKSVEPEVTAVSKPNLLTLRYAIRRILLGERGQEPS